jgi:hypothetical protein
MLIEVRTDGNIKGSEQSYAQVKAEVHAALDRYGDRIRRVDVHLSDAIGDKAGHDDKCCMIEARRDGREPIVVTHRESTLELAIQGAIHNLKKSVESAFGKETTRDHLRDHH